MNKKTTQIIGIILCALMVFATPVFANTTEAPLVDQSPSQYTLSLKAAIELAMKDNPQLIANDHNQTAGQISIKSAAMTKSATKKALKLAGEYGVFSATTMEQICSKNGYYVNAAQIQYDLSVLERKKIEASIAYNTTNAYYNVVLMDMLLEAAQNSYALAMTNKTVVDAQFAQGLVAKMAYDNAGIAVDAAKCELEAYELNRDIAMRNLKNQLNIDQNSTVILTDQIETEEFTSDVSADIKSALESRYDITAVKKQMELAYQYFDLSGAFTASSAVYNTAYADYINKEYQYNSAVEGIEFALRSEYNTILSNKSSMEIAERTYNMNLSQYEASKLQYDLGMITNIELTDSINELRKSQISFSQAKLNYRMSVEKYKYDIAIGLPQ